MAAAEVGHPRTALQLGLHAVECRDPLGEQVHEVAGPEEPLAAGEDVLVVLVPAVAGAGPEGVLDLGERLQRAQRQLERARQEDRAGGVGQREGLLRCHRVRPAAGVVLDVAAGGLPAQPLVDVARVGARPRRRARGRRPDRRRGRGRGRAGRRAARCRRPSWRRGRRRTCRRTASARPCRSPAAVGAWSWSGRCSGRWWSVWVSLSKAFRVDAGGRRCSRRLRGDCNATATGTSEGGA